MSLQHHAVSGPVELEVDVIGGNYRIVTQSLNEVLVDGRQTHNKSLLPTLDIHGNVVKFVKHQLLPWFNTARGVDAVILVPDGSSVSVKMYNGNLTLSGGFDRVNVNLRHGDVTLGPEFTLKKNGSIKITAGSLRCQRLSEAGFTMPWHSKKIMSLDHDSGVSLRVELRLGELVFS